MILLLRWLLMMPLPRWLLRWLLMMPLPRWLLRWLLPPLGEPPALV